MSKFDALFIAGDYNLVAIVSASRATILNQYPSGTVVIGTSDKNVTITSPSVADFIVISYSSFTV